MIFLTLVVVTIVIIASIVWIIFSLSWFDTARDTKSYSGEVTVDDIYFEVWTFNGDIRVSTWENTEYKIDVEIIARGSSDTEPEDYLDDLTVNMDDNIAQDQLRLIMEFDVPDASRSYLTVDIEVVLPSEATIDLDISTSNGDVRLIDISGDTLEIHTSNGRLIFNNVNAEDISGQTSNGRIECTFPCEVSGQYRLSTSNGAIDLEVSSSSEVGYDLALSTSNGDIDIDLSDMVYSVNEDKHKEAISEGFSSKSVQISIEAETSNGNIDIRT